MIEYLVVWQRSYPNGHKSDVHTESFFSSEEVRALTKVNALGGKITITNLKRREITHWEATTMDGLDWDFHHY